MTGKEVPRQYELRITSDQVEKAVSYIARCGGLFFADTKELRLGRDRMLNVYRIGRTDDEGLLFTIIQNEDDPNTLKVSGNLATPELIKEVQQALGIRTE